MKAFDVKAGDIYKGWRVAHTLKARPLSQPSPTYILFLLTKVNGEGRGLSTMQEWVLSHELLEVYRP